jgi:hypothetical protein
MIRLRIKSTLSSEQHRLSENGYGWLIAFICFVMLGTSCGSAGLESYTKAVGAADEGMAIQTMRSIATAQETYRATHDEYGSFDALTKAGVLDARFAGEAPNLKGYRFTMSPGATSFTIHVDPEATEKQPAVGGRHFFLDSTDGVIRSNSTQPAGPGDPAQ